MKGEVEEELACYRKGAERAGETSLKIAKKGPKYEGGEGLGYQWKETGGEEGRIGRCSLLLEGKRKQDQKHTLNTTLGK